MTIIAFKDGVFDVVRVGVEDILDLFELKVFGLIFIIFLFVVKEILETFCVCVLEYEFYLPDLD